MASQTNTPLKQNGKIPWYVYFFGGLVYTVLAGWLFAESDSSVLAWLCIISSPVGVFYAWRAWKLEKQKETMSSHALQQTAPSRCDGNASSSWAGSLSLDR